MQGVTTALMFCREHHGQAEEAIRFYTSLISGSEIVEIDHYGADDGDMAGNVRMALFKLRGVEYRAIDGGDFHAFTFTPALSLWVECESDEEIESLSAALSEDGEHLMPLGDYGYGRRFGWVQDRYGFSWQLILR